MRKLVVFLLLVLMAAVLVASARASDLKLSPYQRLQLKELARDLKQETASLRQRLRAHRQELMRLYSTYYLDERKVREQIEKINAAQYSLLMAGLDNQLKLRKILSPEQFSVLSQMQRDRVQRFKGFSGPRVVFNPERLKDVGIALEKSEITSAQKQKLRRLYHRTRQSPGRSVRELAAAAKGAERLYNSYELDSGEAHAAIRRVNRAQLDMMLMNLERQKDLRKVLTAEQFAAARDRLAASWQR